MQPGDPEWAAAGMAGGDAGGDGSTPGPPQDLSPLELELPQLSAAAAANRAMTMPSAASSKLATRLPPTPAAGTGRPRTPLPGEKDREQRERAQTAGVGVLDERRLEFPRVSQGSLLNLKASLKPLDNAPNKRKSGAGPVGEPEKERSPSDSPRLVPSFPPDKLPLSPSGRALLPLSPSARALHAADELPLSPSGRALLPLSPSARALHAAEEGVLVDRTREHASKKRRKRPAARGWWVCCRKKVHGGVWGRWEVLAAFGLLALAAALAILVSFSQRKRDELQTTLETARGEALALQLAAALRTAAATAQALGALVQTQLLATDNASSTLCAGNSTGCWRAASLDQLSPWLLDAVHSQTVSLSGGGLAGSGAGYSGTGPLVAALELAAGGVVSALSPLSVDTAGQLGRDLLAEAADNPNLPALQHTAAGHGRTAAGTLDPWPVLTAPILLTSQEVAQDAAFAAQFTAVAVRCPVFQHDTFWGFASVHMLVNDLLAVAGLDSPAAGMPACRIGAASQLPVCTQYLNAQLFRRTSPSQEWTPVLASLSNHSSAPPPSPPSNSFWSFFSRFQQSEGVLVPVPALAAREVLWQQQLGQQDWHEGREEWSLRVGASAAAASSKQSLLSLPLVIEVLAACIAWLLALLWAGHTLWYSRLRADRKALTQYYRQGRAAGIGDSGDTSWDTDQTRASYFRPGRKSNAHDDDIRPKRTHSDPNMLVAHAISPSGRKPSESEGAPLSRRKTSVKVGLGHMLDRHKLQVPKKSPRANLQLRGTQSLNRLPGVGSGATAGWNSPAAVRFRNQRNYLRGSRSEDNLLSGRSPRVGGMVKLGYESGTGSTYMLHRVTERDTHSESDSSHSDISQPRHMTPDLGPSRALSIREESPRLRELDGTRAGGMYPLSNSLATSVQPSLQVSALQTPLASTQNSKDPSPAHSNATAASGGSRKQKLQSVSSSSQQQPTSPDPSTAAADRDDSVTALEDRDSVTALEPFPNAPGPEASPPRGSGEALAHRQKLPLRDNTLLMLHRESGEAEAHLNQQGRGGYVQAATSMLKQLSELHDGGDESEEVEEDKLVSLPTRGRPLDREKKNRRSRSEGGDTLMRRPTHTRTGTFSGRTLAASGGGQTLPDMTDAKSSQWLSSQDSPTSSNSVHSNSFSTTKELEQGAHHRRPTAFSWDEEALKEAGAILPALRNADNSPKQASGKKSEAAAAGSGRLVDSKSRREQGPGGGAASPLPTTTLASAAISLAAAAVSPQLSSSPTPAILSASPSRERLPSMQAVAYGAAKSGHRDRRQRRYSSAHSKRHGMTLLTPIPSARNNARSGGPTALEKAVASKLQASSEEAKHAQEAEERESGNISSSNKADKENELEIRDGRDLRAAEKREFERDWQAFLSETKRVGRSIFIQHVVEMVAALRRVFSIDLPWTDTLARFLLYELPATDGLTLLLRVPPTQSVEQRAYLTQAGDLFLWRLRALGEEPAAGFLADCEEYAALESRSERLLAGRELYLRYFAAEPASSSAAGGSSSRDAVPDHNPLRLSERVRRALAYKFESMPALAAPEVFEPARREVLGRLVSHFEQFRTSPELEALKAGVLAQENSVVRCMDGLHTFTARLQSQLFAFYSRALLKRLFDVAWTLWEEGILLFSDLARLRQPEHEAYLVSCGRSRKQITARLFAAFGPPATEGEDKNAASSASTSNWSKDLETVRRGYQARVQLEELEVEAQRMLVEWVAALLEEADKVEQPWMAPSSSSNSSRDGSDGKGSTSGSSGGAVDNELTVFGPLLLRQAGRRKIHVQHLVPFLQKLCACRQLAVFIRRLARLRRQYPAAPSGAAPSASHEPMHAPSSTSSTSRSLRVTGLGDTPPKAGLVRSLGSESTTPQPDNDLFSFAEPRISISPPDVPLATPVAAFPGAPLPSPFPTMPSPFPHPPLAGRGGALPSRPLTTPVSAFAASPAAPLATPVAGAAFARAPLATSVSAAARPSAQRSTKQPHFDWEDEGLDPDLPFVDVADMAGTLGQPMELQVRPRGSTHTRSQLSPTPVDLTNVPAAYVYSSRAAAREVRPVVSPAPARSPSQSALSNSFSFPSGDGVPEESQSNLEGQPVEDVEALLRSSLVAMLGRGGGGGSGGKG